MTNEALVLVVENDKQCAELIKFMLSRSGYRVIIAEDGLSAQNLIDRLDESPELVLLELMIPFVDGFQLLEQIRRKSKWVNTPVIILSTKNQEQDIIRTFESGASDYVTKPFQLGELMIRVRCQINNRRNLD